MDIMDIANLPRAAAPSLPPLKLRDIEPLDKTTTGTSVTFTLSPPSEPEVVYARPALPVGWMAPEAVAMRSWATAPQDSISALMARNLDQPARGLASQWKGLGAALLNRFATTQADYTQTVADAVAPEAGTKTLPTQALAAAAQGRTMVSFQLQTRSGQTVTLTMAVGSASTAASKGMHVAVQVSGTLSAAERDALVRLADGFEQALDGLGQASAVQLNLTGLLGYDSAIFSRVDLSVKQAVVDGSREQPGPLGHFEWHAGADGSRLSLQSRAGTLAIGIDVDTSAVPANLDRQQAMLRQYLAQFDAAADRSHSNADLVAQFKRAFVQMHETSQARTQSGRAIFAPTSLTPLQTQVQTLLSGLQDFEASFDGDFSHANPAGLTTEVGHSDFQASQKTTTEGRDPEGPMNISQTQSARLAADYVNNSHGGMLDTASGNYDRYRIRDHSETTTTIDMARKQLIGAVVTSLRDEWLGYEKRVNHKVTESYEIPSRKVLSRNLL